jgi:hypothetical protein
MKKTIFLLLVWCVMINTCFGATNPNHTASNAFNAAGAIRKIRDPKKIPELMATVYNESCAGPIRNAALEALGGINTSDVPEFLLDVIKAPQIPVSMQRTAMRVAAERGN